jgi:hypothetical protein
MKSLFSIMFVMLSLFLPFNSAVLACSCPTVGSLEDRVSWWLSNSAAVFTGEVMKLERIQGTREMAATFSVDEFWKGDLTDTVVVKTEINPGMSCGYDFSIGATYLVYASGREDGLETGRCSGNRQRYDPNAKEQVTILGKSKVPERKKP